MLACPELEPACLLLLIGHAARTPDSSSLVGSTLSAVAAILGYFSRSAYLRLLAPPLLHGWFDAGNTLQNLLDAKVRPPIPEVNSLGYQGVLRATACSPRILCSLRQA